jgi:hypothetical protein
MWTERKAIGFWTRTWTGALALGALSLTPPTLSHAVSPADLTGNYLCQFKGEKLDLKVDHSSGQISVLFLVEGAVYEEELYLTDGAKHPYREAGRVGVYSATSSEKGVHVVEYMEDRITNEVEFLATRSGIDVKVKSKNRKISCKRKP